MNDFTEPSNPSSPHAEVERVDPDKCYRLSCNHAPAGGSPCRYQLTVKGSMLPWAKAVMERHVERHLGFIVLDGINSPFKPVIFNGFKPWRYPRITTAVYPRRPVRAIDPYFDFTEPWRAEL